ncbi:MAG: glycosyltransferase family 4 protein [Polaromonas sp.]|nr:glycosyltransferase family 4 protein [Polaromonas sp.]MDP3751399.1 glycosyltransferase family 4 protein [Polaromonas sp.]
MKFIFIAGDINRIGGIEKYNRDFYSALRAAGASGTLVERRAGGLLAKISFVLRTVWTYLRQRPDVILCGHLNFSPICFFISRLTGTPYTLAMYGIEIIEEHRGLLRKAVRHATKIITISEYARALILKQHPEMADSIFMLPSAVDGITFIVKEKNPRLIKQLGIAGRPVLLSLARLATLEHKGQDRVLASLPYILEKIPNAVYLIVGGGTDERINTVLRKYPELSASVVFTGPVTSEEKVDYYNLGDVYVLPSKFEGFSIVFIESLACGVPVVASDGYGCREGLLDGELGLLVPPDDLVAIAQATISILDGVAPKSLYDREYLRQKTLEVYGIETWNKRVKNLVALLAKPNSTTC